MSILDQIQAYPIIPVIVIDDAADAQPLGQALVAGGLPVLEVTLRTDAALDAIKIMAEQVKGGIVGAGTLRSESDISAAKAAGAVFGVSPGSPARLLQAAKDQGLALLPGVATPTEAMAAQDAGFDFLKFFPAEANGGAKALKAWSSPLAGLKFCPTGGVSPANLAEYFSLPNVVCAGGSWMVPNALVKSKDWAGIQKLAEEAVAAAKRAAQAA